MNYLEQRKMFESDKLASASLFPGEIIQGQCL